MQWFSIILFVLAAYLLGSLPSGYLIGRWVADIDVRTVGSKNIGATNVARSLGLRWGLLVLIIDMAKGILIFGDPDTVGEQLQACMDTGIDGITVNLPGNGHIVDRIGLLGELGLKATAP